MTLRTTLRARRQRHRRRSCSRPAIRHAPPLVFLHGGGHVPRLAFAEPWTRQFRVLIPHHPGFGESGDLDGLREVHDLVLHYTELFDQLGLTADVNLVGFSLGGLIAARFAIEQKHRLRRLVLVAPGRAAGAGRRGRGLLPHPARGARPAGSSTDGDARCRYLPDRSPRRRLHRRPLPRDPHDGDHAVGAPVRPVSCRAGSAGSTSRRSWCGARRTAWCRRRSRRRGRLCCPTRRWRRSRTPATSCSTSRPQRRKPWPDSALPADACPRAHINVLAGAQAAAISRLTDDALLLDIGDVIMRALARARRLRNGDRPDGRGTGSARSGERPALAGATRRPPRLLRLLESDRDPRRVRRLALALPGDLHRGARQPRRACRGCAHA